MNYDKLWQIMIDSPIGMWRIFKSHMSKDSILFMWEFIINIFLPPSLFSFSQWRMWLHFLCLYLSVYKPEYWTVSLYKASSSHPFSLSPACSKIYPRQYIQQLKTEGREAARENSSAVSQLQEKQHLQQNKPHHQSSGPASCHYR